MKNFKYYLDQIGEIGFVEEVLHSIVYVSGLPGARPSELVIFESGELGQVISLSRDVVEILLLARTQVRVSTRVARTDELLQVPVGEALLGRAIDPLVKPIDGGKSMQTTQISPTDTQPHGIVGREHILEPLETGVALVDLAVPLAKGQRELVIGDRKTGKTEFLLQTFLSQARKGTICIYAIIGQRLIDIREKIEFIEEKKIINTSIVVASSSSDPSGLIFLTPYTAMTIAEFFRNQDKDVLLILDDMSTHARYYREISLLARRFPGRGSYPGDIFYTHAKLIERAGNFKRGSITCLPVTESVLGDLSGYIQTNLMAMTDGHVFFDIDLYNRGKRPAVNSFLSVTRVGHQAQTSLQKDLSRELSRFMVEYEKMSQFMHFGAEVGETVKKTLDMGRKIDAFFDQSPDKLIPLNANIVILAGLWAGLWVEIAISDFGKEIEQLAMDYQTNENFRNEIDKLINSKKTFSDLVSTIRRDSKILGVKNM